MLPPGTVDGFQRGITETRPIVLCVVELMGLTEVLGLIYCEYCNGCESYEASLNHVAGSRIQVMERVQQLEGYLETKIGEGV